MWFITLFATAIAALVITQAGVESRATQDERLTVILPGPPMIAGDDEQVAGEMLPCTTIDDDSKIIRTKNGLIDPRYRWEFFDVFINPSYNDAERDIIITAMQHLAGAVPCVTFRVYNKGAQPSGDYIHIVNTSGCWSYLGRLGGLQLISLQNPGCVHVGIVIHEMIHALGFSHEQNRSDRDDFVDVLFENITPGAENNFAKADSRYSNFGVPYNYQSIMHYGPFDFSRNGQPVITKKDGSTEGIGSLHVLQSTDIQRLRNMYKC